MKKILVCLLGLGFAAQVLAVPPQPSRAPLSEAQIAQIKAQRQARNRTLTPQQQQMQQLNAQLRADLKKKPVDRDKVGSLLKQIDAQRDAVQIENMQSELDNNKSLTPQQRQRFNEMIQKAKTRQAQQQQQPPAIQ